MNRTIRTSLHVALAGALALVAESAFAEAVELTKKELPPEHYRIAIDPKVALKDLLPIPPKNALPGAASIIEELAKVPEVQLHEPVIVPESKDAAQSLELLKAREKAVVHTARLTAHINFVNKKKTDRYMELLVEHRPDLAGLPFVMGDACRLKGEERKQFKSAVEMLQAVPLSSPRSGKQGAGHDWDTFDAMRKEKAFKMVQDRACVAACMQMLALESAKVRRGLVDRLTAFDKNEEDVKTATHALTRLAVFSQDEEVRHAAVTALLKRDQGVDTAMLLHGLRYPWPSVAKSAAEAISDLKLKDLIPELIQLLDEPDPRAPVMHQIKGKKTPVLREVVRINHHRNCLLCHPPANTPDVMTLQLWNEENKREIEKGVEVIYCNITIKADDVLTGAVPMPGQPLPSGSEGYRRFSSPDVLVRADITYLRQDFSMLQKVADAQPWPEMQRFDFMVRSRALTETQAAAYQAEFAKLTASPYRAAAVAGLRALTGKDAGTSAAAWREALGMK